MAQGSFKTDMNAEGALAVFLDKYFYSKLKDKYEGFSSKRNYNLQYQKQGLDITVTFDDANHSVDEKAALYYSNTGLPTFAFELAYKNKSSKVVDGWFLDDDKITTDYILIWPQVICKKKKSGYVRKKISDIQPQDFTTVEIFWIKKETIKEELKKRKLTEDVLKKIAKNVREGKDNPYPILKDDIKVVFSKHLQEQPVNLVISKKFLFEYSTAAWLVSRYGCGEIKKTF